MKNILKIIASDVERLSKNVVAYVVIIGLTVIPSLYAWFNILLPLVFLIISFLTKSSKLVFLVLWIVSLFGIAFYLLYVEFTDFKLQEKMKEFGIVDEEEEQKDLIGNEVQRGID